MIKSIIVISFLWFDTNNDEDDYSDLCFFLSR